MIVVGLTGGIGSGKTVVSRIFSCLGIPVYDADGAAHRIYEKYPAVTEQVKQEFGEEVVDKYGKINRRKLAEMAFVNADLLKKLNAIVHPLVRKDFEGWVQSRKGFPYVLKEAAILFESGAHKNCHSIIAVSAPVELRILRVRERDHKSRAEIEQIMSKQWDEEMRNKRSTYVIINDESQLVIPQALKIHAELIGKTQTGKIDQ